MAQVNDIQQNGTSAYRPTSLPHVGMYFYSLSFAAVIGGFLFGYDTGIISSAMLYIPMNENMKPMNNIWQEIIVSVTPGFAAVGSFLSGPGSDRFGRKKVIFGSSFIFVFGALICALSFNKVMLVIGRILLGIAIGFASMSVPVYVGEASPSHIRGRLITSFLVMVTFGLLAANVVAGAFSYLNPENIGWRLMFGFAAIPAAIQLVVLFFLPESPRWLYEHGRKDEAEEVVRHIYINDEAWVDYEMHELAAAEEQGEREKNRAHATSTLFKILKMPHVRRSLFVGCMLQAFQQLSGINTILYYTGEILQSSGIKSSHTIIWVSVGLSVSIGSFLKTCFSSAVNFLCTFIPLCLVEKVGRKLLLIVSMIGVAISLALLGVAFLMINYDSIPAFTGTGNESSDCFALSNCDSCVTNEHCGFCQTTASGGFCLPAQNGYQVGDGPCDFFSNPSLHKNNHFYFEFCPTKYTALPIVIIIVYLAFFSSGFASLPWVLNAEFHPLWARGTCVAISTAVNWIGNLVISLTFLSLTQEITKYGTFFLYSGITFTALLFVIKLVPETRKQSIDEVELLFMTGKQRRRVEARLQRRHEHFNKGNVEDPMQNKTQLSVDTDVYTIYEDPNE